jgi:hypothetical protein
MKKENIIEALNTQLEQFDVDAKVSGRPEYTGT